MDNKVVDCLVGLQWGSEGKGKIAAYLAKEYNAMVRSGGPQAGHTFYHNGIKYVNRQLPCGVFNINCMLYIPANGLIKLDILRKEIRRYKLSPDRLMIDKNSMVVASKHMKLEKDFSLEDRIASTTQGVGAAQAEKIWRNAALFDECILKNPKLRSFSNDTSIAINNRVEEGHHILLEGTQGFSLSLNHGNYPYVTSRDVTSSALLSDAGISPKHYGQTIGVMRTYPIRVGGNSGPTGSKELSWKEITKRARSNVPIKEITSITCRVRRVFEQSYAALERAMLLNKPDQIALMFIDYINAQDYGVKNFGSLSSKSKDYINKLEDRLQTPITVIGTGPKENQIIDRRKGG